MLRGRERTGLTTQIILTGAPGAVVAYPISNWANGIGTKSFILRRIHIQNIAGGAGWFNIGTGVGAGVAVHTPLYVLNNIDNYYDNDNGLLPIEFWEDAVVWAGVLVAAGVMNVRLTVEERG
jgi:hypothetical protein